ncbi:MAG: HU family DNA-binding protein [Acidobacteria bacterium]|nr:HU family DNA-binding protein [Acidobacteriota bacterium]
MTKADLVERVAVEAELTKKDAEQLVEIVLDSIIHSLNEGEKIELRGFGSFRIRERNSRKGRNPKTGAAVDIPAKRVAYFKPGKELKELINT